MSWHEGERATVVGGFIISAIALFFYIGLVQYVWDFSSLSTYDNHALAPDFANFWAAAKLTQSGKPALAYNLEALHEVQQQVFGVHLRYGSGYYYPPFFLFAVLPLGLMSYLPAFFIYITVTLVLYLVVLSRLSPHPILMPLCLTFPGMYENFIFGQTGFISGLCLGGGLLCLERAPWIAGIFLGLLTCRPPLVILTLAVLLCSRRWKTLSAALITTLLLSLLSAAVFGYQTWAAYFQVMFTPMELLKNGTTPLEPAATFLAAGLAAGFGLKAASLVQGVMMLVAVAGVAWVWRQPTTTASRNAVLVLGTLVFTPYAFVYDLAILALPLCWLWEEGRRYGRLPGELPLLLLGWLAPFVSPVLHKWVNLFSGKLLIAPAIILVLFFLSLVKAKRVMGDE